LLSPISIEEPVIGESDVAKVRVQFTEAFLPIVSSFPV
jgi:hypothetical protein